MQYPDGAWLGCRHTVWWTDADPATPRDPPPHCLAALFLLMCPTAKFIPHGTQSILVAVWMRAGGIGVAWGLRQGFTESAG